MLDGLVRISVRMIVFAVIGVAGTLIVNHGHYNMSQIIGTLAVFLLLNVAYELFRLRSGRS